MRKIARTLALGAILLWIATPVALAQPAPFNYPPAAAGGGSSSCSSDISTDCSTVLGVGHVTTGVLGTSNGGTGQATAPAARGASGLDIDELTGHGNSAYTILATDRVVATNAAFTAAQTWTLPAANSLNPGQHLTILDAQGTVTSTNTLTIARAGTDTIDGGTSYVIAAAFNYVTLISDGVSKWTVAACTAGCTLTGTTTFPGGTSIANTGQLNMGSNLNLNGNQVFNGTGALSSLTVSGTETLSTASSGLINFTGTSGFQPAIEFNGSVSNGIEYNFSGNQLVFNGGFEVGFNNGPFTLSAPNNTGIDGAIITPGEPGGAFASEQSAFNLAALTTAPTLTGSFATERFALIGQQQFTAASALSISTEAASLAIAGAPTATGSVTIAKSIGLHIQAGSTLTSGVTTGVSLKVDAPTGAGANKAAEISGHVEYTGTAPSVTAGTGATIVGNDVAGRVTVGTSPSTTVALTFASSFTNAPICFAQDETSALTMRATTVSVSAVTFTASATLTASDKVSYRCEGYF